MSALLVAALQRGGLAALVLLLLISAGCGPTPPAVRPASPKAAATKPVKDAEPAGEPRGMPQPTPRPGSNHTPADPKESSKKSTAKNKYFPTPPVLQTLPAFRLVDQAGREFSSQTLQGQVWVASFVSPAEPATGVPLMQQLARFQRQLRHWPERERVRLVSFTHDPAHDTPVELGRAAEALAADASQWTFLTGKRQAVEELTGGGFRLAQSDGSQALGQLAIVDGQGRVRGFFNGTVIEGFRAMLASLRGVLTELPAEGRALAHISMPTDLLYAPWMEDRDRTQRLQWESETIPHDFEFQDRLEESGISFVNRAGPDSAREWKLNHYDHANGLAAADVDGDGLIDLYFLSQIGGNELWRNLGGGRFENVTSRAGVGLRGRVSVSASFADVDNDGDPDLYVTTTRHGNCLFLNDGLGQFRDATDESGLVYRGHSSTAEFFDYDRDGRLDLFLVNVGKFTENLVAFSDPERKEFPYYVGLKEAFAAHLFPELAERSILYHNEGNGHFRDVTDEVGLDHTTWSGDATPVDLDADGWIDLYVLGMQGNDEYWRNVGAERFERRAGDTFPTYAWGSMGVKAFDWNQDGFLDLYTTNMHADMWEAKPYGVGEKQKSSPGSIPESYLHSRIVGRNVFGNAFYEGGPGGFREVSDQINAENYWPWGLSVGDLNADGWEDAFITSSMNLQWRYHPNSLLLNDHGKRFVDAEFILGVEPRRDGRIACEWYRLDCDGLDRECEPCAGRTGQIVVWGALGSRGSLICDLDNDGDLDIVTNDCNSPPLVLISDLAQRRPNLRRLSLTLRGTRSNRDGLGARVEVRLAGRTLYQTADGQSGYLSQSALPLYFGLDGEEQIESIVVRWPSGVVQEVPGPIPGHQSLELTEPTQATK